MYKRQALELFINDPETDAVVMIGEIGGGLEAEAARWYKANGSTKPVVGFIAGQTLSLIHICYWKRSEDRKKLSDFSKRGDW